MKHFEPSPPYYLVKTNRFRTGAFLIAAVAGLSACSSSEPTADPSSELASLSEEEKRRRSKPRPAPAPEIVSETKAEPKPTSAPAPSTVAASAPAPAPVAAPVSAPVSAPAASPAPAPAPNPGGVVNHEGRTLSVMPSFSSPVLFNTPEADAILSAMQIMPKNSAWNEDVSTRPVLANSTAMIARIGAALPLQYNLDMGFVIVPPTQPMVNFGITLYPTESDPGPYPIPDQTPIEEWPLNGLSLSAWQASGAGDRHAIIVDPLNQKLYELGNAYRTTSGWSVGVAAKFDLNTNRQRPLEWTSTDAAGLPIFPAVVRYHELARGMVEHAIRFTVQRTRREFIYPASHYASAATDIDLPAMGQRFRLKSSANLVGLSPHALAVARGLQKYGMIVADNGGSWRISVAPDSRISGLNELRRFVGSDFEVIQTTGEFEGPRKP